MCIYTKATDDAFPPHSVHICTVSYQQGKNILKVFALFAIIIYSACRQCMPSEELRMEEENLDKNGIVKNSTEEAPLEVRNVDRVPKDTGYAWVCLAGKCYMTLYIFINRSVENG